MATSRGFRPTPSSYLLSFEVDQRKPVATACRLSPRLSLIARSSAARRRRRTVGLPGMVKVRPPFRGQPGENDTSVTVGTVPTPGYRQTETR